MSVRYRYTTAEAHQTDNAAAAAAVGIPTVTMTSRVCFLNIDL